MSKGIRIILSASDEESTKTNPDIERSMKKRR